MKKLKKYQVRMTINYSVNVEVYARSKKEAEENAEETVCGDFYIEQFLAEAKPTKVEEI